MNGCISIAAPGLGLCISRQDGTHIAHTSEQQMVSGFKPSTSTFNFSPHYWQTVPDWGPDTDCGVAGGMLYATMDFFNAGYVVGDNVETPDNSESMLYRYILHRGRASYRDLLSEYQLLGNAPPMQETWARIRSEIDYGRITPLALGINGTFQMRHLRQVIVYGYRLAGRKVTLFIYDPEFPRRDDVRLELDLCRSTRVEEIIASEAIPGLVHTLMLLPGYRPETPVACCANLGMRYSINL